MDVTYLDHNASSPLSEELLGELPGLAQRCRGNASSLHQFGRQSRRLISEATAGVARFIHCDEDQIYWTSGASEANTWALHSAAAQAIKAGRRPQFLVSALEHDSTWLAARSLGETHVIRALPSGLIDLDHLKTCLSAHSADLVSIVHANNETGVIQELNEIGALCAAAHVPLHLDCAQTLGKVSLNFEVSGISYATFSAHKIAGPTGVGFLIAQAPPSPLISGKQQRSRRGGTENALGVALTGRAIELLLQQSPAFPESLRQWQQEFEAAIKRTIPGSLIHGAAAPRLHNTTFVGFEGVTGDGILINLDLEGICASSGSACSSGTLNPSQVLQAMGCSDALARSSVRFSSGRTTRWSDFERVLKVLPGIVERARTT